jgi:hypothetical protein
MNPKSIQLVPAGIALAAGLSIMLSFAALPDDVTNEEILMQELTGPVADTMLSALGDEKAQEVEKSATRHRSAL